MIVLDTNVLSELMRSQPHPALAAWVAAQPPATLYTTSINCAELLSGIHAMPEGKRRTALTRSADAMFVEDLDGRILPFDSASARRYAEIIASRRLAGKPIAAFDALIAAAASVVGAGVATRDTSGFEGCGLTLVNPWAARL